MNNGASRGKADKRCYRLEAVLTGVTMDRYISEGVVNFPVKLSNTKLPYIARSVYQESLSAAQLLFWYS
jgi:hypothetical protein